MAWTFVLVAFLASQPSPLLAVTYATTNNILHHRSWNHPNESVLHHRAKDHPNNELAFQPVQNENAFGVAPTVLNMIILGQSVFEMVGQRELGCRFKNVCLGLNESQAQGQTEFLDPKPHRLMFTEASFDEWVGFVAVCCAISLFDYVVLQSFSSTFTCHLVCVCLMIVLALFFDAFIWNNMGRNKAFEWLTGYVLEWLLSMDNLFIFHLIFSAYQTPPALKHKALYAGIMGAVLFRFLFFLVMSTLVQFFSWVRYPFGVLLILGGIQAARAEAEDDMEFQDFGIMSTLRWAFGNRILSKYDGNNCFSWDTSGKLQVTPLLVVIICLEVSDLIFALDSVSAKVAQIPNLYIAFTSSALAIFALRSMSFIIADLVNLFDLLRYGISIILILIGVHVILEDYVSIPSIAVLCIIVGIFSMCIVGSSLKARLLARRYQETSADVPQRL